MQLDMPASNQAVNDTLLWREFSTLLSQCRVIDLARRRKKLRCHVVLSGM